MSAERGAGDVRDGIAVVIVLVLMIGTFVVVGFIKNKDRVERLDRRLEHIESRSSRFIEYRRDVQTCVQTARDSVDMETCIKAVSR